MDLDTFIEKDIQQFLDRKAEHQEQGGEFDNFSEDDIAVYSLSEDYANTIREELEKGTVRGARRAYEQLMQEYETLTDGRSKQIGYSVIQECQQLFDEHGLADEIDVPEAPASSYEQRRETKIQRLKKQKRIKDNCTEQIENDIDRVDQLLDQGDPLAAVYVYKNAKNQFRRIPKRFTDVRDEIYDELITCYYQIRKRTGRELEEIVDDHESAKAHLISTIHDVRDLIRKKKLEQAHRDYEHLVDELRSYDGEGKEKLVKDIKALKESLQQAEDAELQRKQRSPPKSTVKQSSEAESTADKLRRNKRKAYSYLSRGNVASAMKQYDQLKGLYDELKGDAQERLRRDLVDLHQDILDEQKDQLHGDGSQTYREETEEIQQLLDEGDVQEAKQRYIELQARLSDEDTDDEKLHETLRSLKNKITTAQANQAARA